MKRTGKQLTALLAAMICLLTLLVLPASAKSDLPAVINQAKEGVVKLYAVGFDEDGYAEVACVGSGFAVGEKGETPEYFVTNWHVACVFVDEDHYYDSHHVRIWIMLDNFTISDVTGLPSEATAVECSVVRMSESGYPDYAILRSVRPVKECTPMPIRQSEEMQQGEQVVALGCPQVVDIQSLNIGSNEITATTGSVARHMVMTTAGNTDVLLHTALISGGNSGGPLIDEYGNVVGLNTYGIVDSYACAIYSKYITEMLDDLSISYIHAGARDNSKLIVLAAGAAAAVVLVVAYLVLRNRKAAPVPAPTPASTPHSMGGKTSPAGFSLRFPDGSLVPLSPGKLLVGRDPACQVRIPADQTQVSRRHCSLEISGEHVILTDEGSHNGTFIHGQRIPVGGKVALKRGSSFALGNTGYTFTVC